MRKPKVSIIIPVHDDDAYIESCVRSVMEQTLRDIEIICVDDASTDNSPQLLRALAMQDSRVKVLTLHENLSASQARKNGVLASTGETIMFLDGDDVLLPEACEIAYRSMHERGVDVLHFGTKVINCVGVPESRLRWNQNKIAPCLEFIEGDLVLSCFHEGKFFFTLWNKMFRGEVARNAMSHIEDGSFPRAQDMYAVFFLLLFSKSYAGIPDILHHYNFGIGITGNRTYELPMFERFCLASRVANAIQAFVEKNNLLEKYGAIVAGIRKGLLNDAIGQWMGHLRSSDVAAGFDLLAQNWGAEELVAALAEKSIAEPTNFDVVKIAHNVRHTKVISTPMPKKLKTIGIFYHRYHSGGVQRVISLLIPLFMQWGFKVVLITEEYEPGNEYPLPEGVERALIPVFVSKKPADYRRRADALADVIRRYEIDVWNSHASSAESALFDMLLAKSLGCYVVLSRHEIAFASFLNGTRLPTRQPAIFSLADKLVVLTRMDEQYYKCMGISAVYIPNPLPQLDIQLFRPNSEAPIILWVGRMDFVQKQCQEPIEIMREVVQLVPKAKLMMIGGGWSPGAEQKLRDRVDALGLRKNVELLGYTPNPEKYYREATCQLMTSAWESYGMVIQEGRAFGLPLVLYDMPYLELLKNGKGYISVEQSNRQAAADALVRLLSSPELRAQKSAEAREELAASSNSLVEERWKQIFSFSRDVEVASEFADMSLVRMLMECMLHLYGKGVMRKDGELSAVKKELAEVQKKMEASFIAMSPQLLESRSDEAQKNEIVNEAEQRTLEALDKRRARLGSLGALDFLIERERKRRSV